MVVVVEIFFMVNVSWWWNFFFMEAEVKIFSNSELKLERHPFMGTSSSHQKMTNGNIIVAPKNDKWEHHRRIKNETEKYHLQIILSSPHSSSINTEEKYSSV